MDMLCSVTKKLLEDDKVIVDEKLDDLVCVCHKKPIVAKKYPMKTALLLAIPCKDRATAKTLESRLVSVLTNETDLILGSFKFVLKKGNYGEGS